MSHVAHGIFKGDALPFEHQIGGKQHRPSDTEAKQAKYKAKTFMRPVDRSGCVYKPVTPGLRGQLESTFYRLMFDPPSSDGPIDPPLSCPQLADVPVCRGLLPFLPPYFGVTTFSHPDELPSGTCDQGICVFNRICDGIVLILVVQATFCAPFIVFLRLSALD
jgi:hypothetical protein